MSRYHAHLDTRRWARTRRQALRRDDYRCRSCGRAGRLEADHVVPLAVDPDQDAYDIDGCQTLCRGCHIEKTAAENRDPMIPGRQEWLDMVAQLLQNEHVT